MEDQYKPVLLGELLTKAGLLTEEMLTEALQRAHETRLPLGKILVWSGYLNERQLQAAVEAQSLINDRMLTVKDAIRALSYVMERRQNLNAALDELGWTPSEMFERNRLGDLMVAAAMVTTDELDEALTTAISTGLPLGQVLACCPPPLNHYVKAALSAQSMIREARIERAQAIEALKLAKQHSVSLEQALLELGIREVAILHTLEFSELLLFAGVISNAKLLRAVEYSLCAHKPVADCLVELGFLTEETLAAAKQLRESANHGDISRALAIDALRRVHEDGLAVSRALAVEADRSAIGAPRISATDLLRLASFVTKEDIEKVLPQARREQEPSDQALGVHGIDEDTFSTILQCMDLIERNAINLQQAIVVLYLCLRRKLSLAESLGHLGLKQLN